MIKCEKRKILVSLLIFLAVTVGIIVSPVKATNVTLQFNTEGLENGEKLIILVENSDGDMFRNYAAVYNDVAEIRLAPDYYNLDNVEIENSNNHIMLQSISVYSGKYDTSQDKLLKKVKIGEGQASDYGKEIVLSDKQCSEISKVAESGIEIKKYIILACLLLYILYLVHSLKRGILFKYLEILLWIIVGIAFLMTLFHDRFHLPENYNVYSNVEADTDDFSEITIDGKLRSEFIAWESNLKKINIDLQYDDDSKYEDIGASVIDKDTGELIYSKVFTESLLESKKKIEIVFGSSIKNSENKVYQVELEPLGEDAANSINIIKDESTGEIVLTSAYNRSFLNRSLLIGCIFALIILLAVAFGYKDFKLSPRSAVRILYIAVLGYMLLQIFYYYRYVGNTPDELAHFSYIEYLLENRTIIPDFPNMHLYQMIDDNLIAYSDMNYLGHPPLYYWILAAVQLLFGRGIMDFTLLRLVSVMMAVCSICICFYLGYTRLPKKKPYLHLLYALAVISVPFMTYGFSGVNNDTLSFLGVALAFWGVLRFEEKQRGYRTYLLLASGMFLVVFSKLTAGLVLFIAYAIYIAITCMREKSLKCIFNKKCIVVLPFVFVIAGYFGYLFFKYGYIQPTLGNMDPAYYKVSNFYVAFAERQTKTIPEFIQYYWEQFLSTWSQINSHVYITKYSKWFGLDRIIYVILLGGPILLFKFRHNVKAGNFCLSVFIGIAVAMLIQFFNSFKTFFYVAGYTGGYQSRYYLCWVPILAFTLTVLFEYAENKTENKHNLKTGIRICAGISMVLFVYGSFMYTLLDKVH